MNAAEFTAWIRRSGLSRRQAGDLLCAEPNEVGRWIKGTRCVPGRVTRIVELTQRSKQRNARALRWRRVLWGKRSGRGNTLDARVSQYG